MKLIVSILLALLPLFVWIIQYFYSKSHNLLKIFRKHWTCYYGDFIFVIINFFFIYSVSISKIIYFLALISIIVNLCAHAIWGNQNKKKSIYCHLYYKKTNKLNLSGYAHLVFSIIETTIILGIIFLTPKLPIIFIELFILLIFGYFILIGSYKLHSKINRMDLLAVIIIWLSVLIKLSAVLLN